MPIILRYDTPSSITSPLASNTIMIYLGSTIATNENISPIIATAMMANPSVDFILAISFLPQY